MLLVNNVQLTGLKMQYGKQNFIPRFPSVQKFLPYIIMNRGENMNDIVNLIINSSTSVVIIAYFIFRDYKWNEQLISTLTKIEKILDDMSERSENGKK